ncbi:methyltransferase domain-containing protein, partial [Streptomyces sp. NPDC059900]|uniref:methyltransferase domain-containing protein n=2 Tax=Streptomyces sp. NPDC059900 TaxID=3155816 RepID=UPI003D04103F
MDFRQIASTELEAMGAFRSPWLRPAFHAVDREAFAPALFWSPTADDDGRYPVLDRERDENGWRRTVWGTHASLITQIDDGAVRPEDGPALVGGDFTSSISALDIAYEKLNHLDLEEGRRVLHVGTASGYDSALLCERVGEERLTTIEFDPVLAAWGEKNLRAAGYAPTTVCGDGLAGWEPTAPYDRIIATCAVRTIPDAWRQQAAEGALILAPLTTAYSPGALMKLTVRNGVASGRFVGPAFYMLARSHRINRQLNPPDSKTKTASAISPATVLDRDWGQDFAIGLHT